MNKKILLSMFCIVLLLGSVSAAFEFDNRKDYDPSEKKITVKNFFGLGDTIANIKLIQNTDYCIINCNATIQLDLYQNYNHPLKAINIYLPDKTTEVEIIDLQLLISDGEKEVQYPTYELVCYDDIEGGGCTYVENGTITKTEINYVPYTNNRVLKPGRYYIKVNGQKEPNQNVDWIIDDFFGIRIDEWAVWNAGLNVDLFAYWNFSSQLESIQGGVFNLSVFEPTPIFTTTAALIDKSGDFNGNNSWQVEEQDQMNFDHPGENMSISLWYNTTTTTNASYTLLSKNDGVGWIISRSTLGLIRAAGFSAINLDANLNTSNIWRNIIITKNSTNSCIWLNSILQSCGANSSMGVNLSINTTFGADSGGGSDLNGSLDEIGFWNRTLTPTEISDLYNNGLGITQQGIDQSALLVTLNSPADTSTITDLVITFNASINATFSNLTNATLFVYDPSGGIFNTTTNIITGQNISNTTTFDVGGFFLGDFNWNVLGCAVNNTATICQFASSNFSFTWQSFEIDNETFNTDVFETSNQTFTINLTTQPSILSISADLIYNGTAFPGTTNCQGINCSISSVIDIELVNAPMSENKTFFWNFTIFNGTDSLPSNSSVQQQNVTRIFLEQCNATFTTETLNFTAFDEQNLSRISPFQFEGTFDFWLGSGAVFRNSSFSQNVTEMTLCLQPNETIKTSAIVNYDEAVNTSTYTDRFFYFDTHEITNITQLISLYLLQSSASTSFILKVQDENLLPVRDALIEIHRFYPGTNEFRIVQIAQTDDNGKSIGFFQTETVDYKFIIKKGGETLLETGTQKVIPETSPFTLTFNTGANLGEPWKSQNEIDSLVSNLTFNRDTGIVTYTYVDSSNNFTLARLLVEQESLLNSSAYITICNDNLSIASASITCDVGNSSGFYIASAFITRTGEGLDKQINFQIETLSSVAGFLGLFFGFFLILISSFMFKFNEVAGIWAMTIVIFLINIMGLIKFGGVFVTAIIGIAIILTWVLEARN